MKSNRKAGSVGKARRGERREVSAAFKAEAVRAVGGVQRHRARAAICGRRMDLMHAAPNRGRDTMR